MYELQLLSSSSDSLSFEGEAEGDVSFRGSYGEEIGGGVSGLMMMAVSLFFRRR